MASEQLEPQCGPQCHCRHHSRRAPDHAATAALCATRPERKATIVDPAVADYRLMRDTRGTGSGALANHAAAGAIIAHSRSRSYSDRKGKQRATERPQSLVRDYHDVEALHQGQYTRDGFQAASTAVRESQPPEPVPPPTRGMSWDVPGSQDDEHHTVEHERAVRAASGAFVNSRRTAESPPTPKPRARQDVTVSAASAADAIRRSQHRGDEDVQSLPEITGSEAVKLHHAANESARHTITEPLYKLEGQDKRSVERAAAVSLSRDMEDPSKKRDELPSMHGARDGVDRSRSQRVTVSDPAAVQRAILLQYAAETRAADRIAEMQTDLTDYQRYYGTEPPSRQPRSRLSVRRRRTRTPSVGDTSMVDVERSAEIRNQMSTLQERLNEVDEQKQKDRDQLMDAARKNVDAAIREMEHQIYAETGRAPASMRKELEEAAMERAEVDTEAHSDYGDMINLGAGQLMDPNELEATARQRVQPTLHEIHDRVDEHRAREVEERLDRDEEARREQLDREREASLQARERESSLRASRKEKVTRSGIFGKLHNRAEEQKARKTEDRLDRDERKRHKTTERQREADTRSEEHQLIAAEQDEQKKRRSKRSKQSKPSEEKERPVQREPPAEREPAAAAAEGGAEAEPSSQEEFIPEMTRSQTAQGDGGVVAAAPAEAAPERPQPTTGAKLRSWFRDRLGRRVSESAQEPAKVTPEEMEGTARPAEGAAVAAEDDSRGAALSSHPVTGDDLAQMQNGDRRPSMAQSLAQQHSAREHPTQNVTRSADSGEREPATNGVPRGGDGDASSTRTEREETETETGAPDNTHHEAHHHGAEHPAPTAEREDLRESAAEQGLPAPPGMGERGSHSSAARESRFSEDL